MPGAARVLGEVGVDGRLAGGLDVLRRRESPARRRRSRRRRCPARRSRSASAATFIVGDADTCAIRCANMLMSLPRRQLARLGRLLLAVSRVFDRRRHQPAHLAAER